MELFEVVCKMLLFIVIMLNILIETVFHSWQTELHARFCAPSVQSDSVVLYLSLSSYPSHAVPYNTVQHDRDKDRSSTVKVEGAEHPDEILTLHS